MDEFLIQLIFSIIFLFSCTIFIFNGAICSKGDAVEVNDNVIKQQPPPPAPKPRIKTPVPQPRIITPVREKTPFASIKNEDILSVGQIENNLSDEKTVNDYVEPEIDNKTEESVEVEPEPMQEPVKKPVVKMNFSYWDLSLSIAEEEDAEKKVLMKTKTKPPIVEKKASDIQIYRKQSELSVKSEFFRNPMGQSSRKPSEVPVKLEIREPSKTSIRNESRSSSIHKLGQPIINMDFEEYDDNISIKDSKERQTPLERSTPVSRKSTSRKSVHSKDQSKTFVNEEKNEYANGDTTGRKRQIKMGFDDWDCDISIEESVKQQNETRKLSLAASEKNLILVSRNNSEINNDERKFSSRNVSNRSQIMRSRQSDTNNEQENGEMTELSIISGRSSINQVQQEKPSSRLPSVQNSRKPSIQSSINNIETDIVKSRQSVYSDRENEANISRKSSSNQILQHISASRVQSEKSSRRSSINKIHSNEIETNKVMSRQQSQNEINQTIKSLSEKRSAPVSRKASSVLFNGEEEHVSLNQTRNTQIKFEFNKWDHEIKIKEQLSSPSVSMHTPINSDILKESLKDMIDDNDQSIHSFESNQKENNIHLSFNEWDKPLTINTP
jgi:hypothetical protein